jgi:hypothetical protein
MKKTPKAPSLSAESRAQLKRELREALKLAIDKEHRFGLRADARPELDANWDRMIDKLEEFLRGQ